MLRRLKTFFVVASLTIGFSDTVICARLTPPATTRATTAIISSEYHGIREIIGADPAAGMTSWCMHYDHLFMNGDDFGEPDSLRERCKRFVRISGAVDFLFQKLLDEHISEQDVLAVAEILVFWAGDDQPGDDSIKSKFAAPVLEALKNGKFTGAAKRYPDLKVELYIDRAAQKATP
jgi:hypothetical protein